MGGSIAAKYVLEKIEPRPESLILVCAPARFVARNGSGIGMGQHPGAVKKMQKLIKSDPDVALRGFVQTFFEAGEVIDKAMTETIEALLVKEPFPAPAEVLIQTLDELDKTDLTQHEGDHDVPVLLIQGALDKICPSGGQKLWDDLFTRIDRVTMPDCGHAPHLTRPRELAREISRFLSIK
jgi:pimeloyl-[acyl-carrier protein] methyl ester esterase